MTQSIVNFLVYGNNDPTQALVLDARVFDYRIGSNEKLAYETLMQQLQEAINNKNVISVSKIIAELNKWSTLKTSTTDGVVTSSLTNLKDVNDTTILTFSSSSTTMNSDMASALDRIIRTLRSAGWDPLVYPITSTSSLGYSAAIAAINKTVASDTQTLYPVLNYITQGLQSAQGALLVAGESGIVDTSNTSLQQLLMVEYVNNGNQILFDKMSGLSTAINSNQEALSYLNSLQNLMNQKQPEQFLLALNDLSGKTLTQTDYSTFEKDSFNKTLETISNFSDATLETYVTNLKELSSDQVSAIQANAKFDTEMSTFMSDIYTYFWNPLQASVGGSSYAGTSTPGEWLANMNFLSSVPDNTSTTGWQAGIAYRANYKAVYADMTDVQTKYTAYIAAKESLSTSTSAQEAFNSTLIALKNSLQKLKEDTNTLLNGTHGLTSLATMTGSNPYTSNPNQTLLAEGFNARDNFISNNLSSTITNWMSTLTSYIADATPVNYNASLQSYVNQLAAPMTSLLDSLNSYELAANNMVSKLTTIDADVQQMTEARYFNSTFTKTMYTTRYQTLIDSISTLKNAIATYKTASSQIGSTDLLTSVDSLITALTSFNTAESTFFNGTQPDHTDGFTYFVADIPTKKSNDPTESSKNAAINVHILFFGTSWSDSVHTSTTEDTSWKDAPTPSAAAALTNSTNLTNLAPTFDAQINTFSTDIYTQFWTPLSTAIGGVYNTAYPGTPGALVSNLATMTLALGDPLIALEARDIGLAYRTQYNIWNNDRVAVNNLVTAYQTAQTTYTTTPNTTNKNAYINAITALVNGLQTLKDDTNTMLNGQNGLIHLKDITTNPFNAAYYPGYVNIMNDGILARSHFINNGIENTINSWMTHLEENSTILNKYKQALSGGTDIQPVTDLASSLRNNITPLSTTLTPLSTKLGEINTSISGLTPSIYFTNSYTKAIYTTRYTDLQNKITALNTAIATYNTADQAMRASPPAITNAFFTAVSQLNTAIAAYQTSYSTFFNGIQSDHSDGFPTFAASLKSIAPLDTGTSQTAANTILATFYGINTSWFQTIENLSQSALHILGATTDATITSVQDYTNQRATIRTSLLATLDLSEASAATTLSTLNNINANIAFLNNATYFNDTYTRALYETRYQTLIDAIQALQRDTINYQNTDSISTENALHTSLTAYNEAHNTFFNGTRTDGQDGFSYWMSNTVATQKDTPQSSISSTAALDMLNAFFGSNWNGSTTENTDWIQAPTTPINSAITDSAQYITYLTDLSLPETKVNTAINDFSANFSSNFLTPMITSLGGISSTLGSGLLVSNLAGMVYEGKNNPPPLGIEAEAIGNAYRLNYSKVTTDKTNVLTSISEYQIAAAALTNNPGDTSKQTAYTSACSFLFTSLATLKQDTQTLLNGTNGLIKLKDITYNPCNVFYYSEYIDIMNGAVQARSNFINNGVEATINTWITNINDTLNQLNLLMPIKLEASTASNNLKTDISSVSSSIATIASNITSINTNIESLTTSKYFTSSLTKTTYTTRYSDLQTKISALQTAITNYNTNPNSKDCVTALKEAITAYQLAYETFFNGTLSDHSDRFLALVEHIKQIAPIDSGISQTAANNIISTVYGINLTWLQYPITTINTTAINMLQSLPGIQSLLTTLSNDTTVTTKDSAGTVVGAFADLSGKTQLFDIELQRIKDNLNFIISDLQKTTGTTGLTNSLTTVLNDFTKIKSVAAWVKDFDTVQQGNYQTNLNNAVVASQALNDAKREELQQVMFIFEEFYKSAMALLSRLTQLIEKMATAINR